MRALITASLLVGLTAAGLSGCSGSGADTSRASASAAAAAASSSAAAAVSTWKADLTGATEKAYRFVDQMLISTKENAAQLEAEHASCDAASTALDLAEHPPSAASQAQQQLDVLRPALDSLAKYCALYLGVFDIYGTTYEKARKAIPRYEVNGTVELNGTSYTCNTKNCVTPDKSRWPAYGRLRAAAYVKPSQQHADLFAKTGAPFPSWKGIVAASTTYYHEYSVAQQRYLDALAKRDDAGVSSAAQHIDQVSSRYGKAFTAACTKVYGPRYADAVTKAKSSFYTYYGHRELVALQKQTRAALSALR